MHRSDAMGRSSKLGHMVGSRDEVPQPGTGFAWSGAGAAPR